MEELKKCKCLRCSYEWIARVPSPLTCSRCKSRIWNKELANENISNKTIINGN